MPVSVRRDPFSGQPIRPTCGVVSITPAQANVLRVLMPEDPSLPKTEWPLLNRVYLRKELGFRPTHTMNRLLNGQNDRPGNKVSKPGLIPLGLIEVFMVYLDSTEEVNLRITEEGIRCLSHHDEIRK